MSPEKWADVGGVRFHRKIDTSRRTAGRNLPARAISVKQIRKPLSAEVDTVMQALKCWLNIHRAPHRYARWRRGDMEIGECLECFRKVGRKSGEQRWKIVHERVLRLPPPRPARPLRPTAPALNIHSLPPEETVQAPTLLLPVPAPGAHGSRSSISYAASTEDQARRVGAARS